VCSASRRSWVADSGGKPIARTSSAIADGRRPERASVVRLRRRAAFYPRRKTPCQLFTHQQHGEHGIGVEPPQREQQRLQGRHIGPVRIINEEDQDPDVAQLAEGVEQPGAHRQRWLDHAGVTGRPRSSPNSCSRTP
jgi:hypothetical protein